MYIYSRLRLPLPTRKPAQFPVRNIICGIVIVVVVVIIIISSSSSSRSSSSSSSIVIIIVAVSLLLSLLLLLLNPRSSRYGAFLENSVTLPVRILMGLGGSKP